MKRLAIASVLLLAGCEGQVGLNVDSRSEHAVAPKAAAQPTGGYSVNVVAVSRQGLPSGDGWGKPINLVEIKNKKTGKTHLVAYHQASGHGETMIKLEEWTEATPKPTPAPSPTEATDAQ